RQPGQRPARDPQGDAPSLSVRRRRRLSRRLCRRRPRRLPPLRGRRGGGNGGPGRRRRPWPAGGLARQPPRAPPGAVPELLGTLLVRRRLPPRGHPPRTPRLRLHPWLAALLPRGLRSPFRAAPRLVRRRSLVSDCIETEVCIVGGGPAGAVAAWKLARLGHAVVVVERSPFPRPQV